MKELQNSISSTRLKLVREYSFFKQTESESESETTPYTWRIFPSSPRKEEVVFPQIIQPAVADNSFTNPTKKIRLFGVNIPIDHLDDQIHKKKTTSTRRKTRNLEAPVPPPFHPIILQRLTNQQQRPIYLFTKRLEFSDIAPGLNRLLIPKGDWEGLTLALTKEEREKVIEINNSDFLRIVTTDNSHGNEFTLHLKMWPTSRGIVLNHEWRKLVATNELKKGDSVQGWGYRINGEFRMALVIN